MPLPDKDKIKFITSDNGKTDFIVLSTHGTPVHAELFTHKEGDNPQLFIKGSSFKKTWKGELAIDKEGNGYKQTDNTAAVAIFNADRSNRLIAMAVGEVSGSGDKKNLTVSAILNNDNVLVRLPEPVTVNLNRRDGISTIVDKEGTKKLIEVTTSIASKHYADVALKMNEKQEDRAAIEANLGILVPSQSPNPKQQEAQRNKELQNLLDRR